MSTDKPARTAPDTLPSSLDADHGTLKMSLVGQWIGHCDYDRSDVSGKEPHEESGSKELPLPTIAPRTPAFQEMPAEHLPPFSKGVIRAFVELPSLFKGMLRKKRL
ncbi:MAG TPA: hypothetical protein VLA04_06550 [Verrucomicrobiae bacterium]|nr:hypothetical protein [Verrucomicrobiae bacterium]